MSNVDVLIVVDVEGALASQNLQNNVYLIDTNKFMGSYNEGGAELYTKVSNGQTVTWSVAPVDPNTSAVISSFTGQAITQNIISPIAQAGGSWSSEAFLPNPTGQQYQYSVVLGFEGSTLPFDPFLVSV
jgi:hypothetical protein